MTIPVLLMESPVAGFQFHEGELRWKDLRVGQALELVREPGNRHDARAIRVHWRDTILGYVPREANFALAQMLDRGERINGRISLLRECTDPWQRVMMQLILHANAAITIPNLVERAAHKFPSLRDPKPASPSLKSITYPLPIPDSLEQLLFRDLTAWQATKDAIKRASAKEQSVHPRTLEELRAKFPDASDQDLRRALELVNRQPKHIHQIWNSENNVSDEPQEVDENGLTKPMRELNEYAAKHGMPIPFPPSRN